MQLRLEQRHRKDGLPDGDGETTPRAIECDDFPFEQLSRIAERESWRKEIYRPIYHVHKWWAQRLGSVFRGILLGALAPQGTDVLALFHSQARFPNAVVFDPFMGSGTTLGEVLKLGGRAIGRDINPVSLLQVRTALTLGDSAELERMYLEIEADVADAISDYYTTRLRDGTLCRVLYYFWVMQAPCPCCRRSVDLFSRYVFARHAYPRRNPTVQVVCPQCGAVSPKDYRVRDTSCSTCGHRFDASSGPVRGKVATCPTCLHEFVIGETIRKTGSPPSYRMYAKLVLTPDGEKEYHAATDYDHALYDKAVGELAESPHAIPLGSIEPGHNTNQVLNYGFRSWNEMFNARQLLLISKLATRIKQVRDPSMQDAFTCLLSGVLEFNNMFASYKGEGTGAVRHMFYHHILKPERTPLEANIWGTPKSSGAFSTLFRSRLLRAQEYARDPFELALVPDDDGGSQRQSMKLGGINEPLVGLASAASYEQFATGRRLYLSCGDSASTDMPDECVDLIVTDPPFFDNVHYSELADFFYVWQQVILEGSPGYLADTTRSPAEVQNGDATVFADRLTRVFEECFRVLRGSGLLVFTYHHSRWEGWRSVLKAVRAAGFRIEACQPVKAEMSVATPKRQAADPINFDVIVVCRKNHSEIGVANSPGPLPLARSLERAEAQIARLSSADWELSRNDIGVVVMAQVAAELSRLPEDGGHDLEIDQIEGSLVSAIDRLHRADTPPVLTNR